MQKQPLRRVLTKNCSKNMQQKPVMRFQQNFFALLKAALSLKSARTVAGKKVKSF